MSTNADRRAAELTLLESIYPSEVSYHAQPSELRYHDETGTLTLRLPASYPAAKPTVITAQLRPSGLDVHDRIRETIASLAEDEECLDAIISAFKDAAASLSPPSPRAAANEPRGSGGGGDGDTSTGTLTVVIWLHHLLAPAKRKRALRPPAPVAGLTKPGSPGVMLFAGPAAAVRAHVAALKALNWQAFQVRYEEAEAWRFGHGGGMRECESMGAVVDGVGEGWREKLVRALGIK